MEDVFFARGAEAKLYPSILLGERILIKERTAKEYRVKGLDEQLRKARTRNEARVVLRAAAAGINVPRILSVGRFSIYMERLQGRRLREARLSNAQKKKVWKEIGGMLARMHGSGITHGDFTPANIMLCKKGIYIIDFGLAALSDELEEKAVDVLLMGKSIPKDEFSYFIAGYKSYKEWKRVISKTEEIMKRGRYQIRGEKNIDDESGEE